MTLILLFCLLVGFVLVALVAYGIGVVIAMLPGPVLLAAVAYLLLAFALDVYENVISRPPA